MNCSAENEFALICRKFCTNIYAINECKISYKWNKK
ncbi:Uncharacterised protein [Enterobacter cancerogenus]|uniref:Uncharacterized protein n=1 Tax=Enterobacter cancerogenus TaxID=69218 RepID=A0A484Z881_9ENTR|nr:Uncharacterised protein [Enterobacter cancerogenus]